MWLKVKNIRVNVAIGIHEWEKVIKRLVLVEANIKIVGNPLDYDDVVHKIKSACSKKRFDYIEDLAKHIKSDLKTEFCLDDKDLGIKITKPNFMHPIFHHAKVEC